MHRHGASAGGKKRKPARAILPSSALFFGPLGRRKGRRRGKEGCIGVVVVSPRVDPRPTSQMRARARARRERAAVSRTHARGAPQRALTHTCWRGHAHNHTCARARARTARLFIHHRCASLVVVVVVVVGCPPQKKKRLWRGPPTHARARAAVRRAQQRERGAEAPSRPAPKTTKQ